MSLHLSTKQPWPLTESVYSYPCPLDGGPEAPAYKSSLLHAAYCYFHQHVDHAEQRHREALGSVTLEDASSCFHPKP